MADPIRTLSLPTIQELQQMLRWWRQSPRAGHTGQLFADRLPNDRLVRWARTTVDASYPTYPSGTKVIACEFGDYTFDDSAVADVDGTFTPYVDSSGNSDMIRYVYFTFGWRPKGSIVRCTLHDGKWFCLNEPELLKGVISEYGGIAAGASGDFDVYFAGAITSPLQTITVYFDWMAAGTAANGAEATVCFFPDEDHFTIVNLEC